MLYGSNKYGAYVMMNGKQVQLGDAVRAAYAKTGLTVDGWNALAEDVRDALIGLEIDQ